MLTTNPAATLGKDTFPPGELFPGANILIRQIQKAEIMVCVLSKTGQPLMPTENHGMVRKLLKTGKAKVVRRTPFTVQMLITTHCYRQPVSLGIGAGSKAVGVSATTERSRYIPE